MDDLLDLNWSSGTSATSSKPISPNLPNPIQAKSSPTPFDFLAKPTNGSAPTPNYYSSTPLRSATPNTAPISVNAKVQGTAKLGVGSGTATPVTGGTSSNDAFSSLLSLGPTNGEGSKHVSLAQKQEQMAEEKRLKEERERQQFEAHGDFWDKLGGGAGMSGGSSRPIVNPTLQPIPTRPKQFDGLLQPIGASRPASAHSYTSLKPESSPGSASASTVPHVKSFLDEDDFMAGMASTSRPPARSSPTKAKSPRPIDPFDFDQLAAVEPVKNGVSRGDSGMRTPLSDFDFGDGPNGARAREDDDDDDDDHDWLKELNKPVAQARQQMDSRHAPPSNYAPRPARAQRSASPPPHVVGQIVEMGFSPAQARTALAKTATGLDVQAAMEILLGGKSEQANQREVSESEEDDDRMERERLRREEEDRERRRRRRAGPSRDSVKARDTDEMRASGGGGAVTPSLQAEQILAQATEIGQNVFTRATSLWASSKEKAMKVYEEQRKAYEAGQPGKADSKGKAKDGRPRWMVEAEQGDLGQADEWRSEKYGGFRDDGDLPPRQARDRDTRRDQAGSSASATLPTRRPKEDRSDNYVSVKERADLLFADEAPRYVSAARHRKPNLTPSSSSATAPSSSSRQARPAVPAAPLPQRTTVEASPSQIQSSAAHRSRGNEHFKLGRFTEAENAYSTAITSLPENHLHLIALYNNRAATRLKLGQSSGAAEDCSTVIGIIGPSYHPNKEAPLPSHIAAEIKLADGLVKAHVKRAQAWEMGEKWKKAVEDWEKVLGLDAALLGGDATVTKNLAAEGLRRSKAMMSGDGAIEPQPSTASRLNGGTSHSSATHPRSKPVTVATSRTNTPANPDRSQAVSSLRQAAQAQDKEDEQRMAVKDSVDAKLAAWKGGKETNLRGLIASLDMVLWDEIMAGGLKVGMHELISEKQVKVRYMKVIARLHPDKLDTKKTTVEQRMLANGAFSALNDAWVAFNGA